jgi:hypothetical protein
MKDWNPRYAAFAYAHSLTPQQQLHHDCAQPGKMVGFMLWNSARWREWEKETGWRGVSKSTADHDAYDAWLAAKFAEPVAAAEREMSVPTLFDLLDGEAA